MTTQPQTGPLQFSDSPPGVYLRPEHAQHCVRALRMTTAILRAMPDPDLTVLAKAATVIDLLESHQSELPPQRLRAFGECLAVSDTDRVPPPGPSDVFKRGEMDCIQDGSENAPFACVGGLEKRGNMRAPHWIATEDREEYLHGYRCAAKRQYGEDWMTCSLGWAPAIIIGGEDSKPAPNDWTGCASAVHPVVEERPETPRNTGEQLPTDPNDDVEPSKGDEPQ